MTLKNGHYNCTGCDPTVVIDVKADGTDQKVTGTRRRRAPARPTRPSSAGPPRRSRTTAPADTFEETYQQGGKTVSVNRVSVHGDTIDVAPHERLTSLRNAT